MSIEAKDDGGGGENWHYKLYKAPVTKKTLLPTNQPTNQSTPLFTGRMPFLSPNRVKALKENITSHKLAYHKLTWGLPTLSLTTNSSWLPGGGLPCLSSAPDASNPTFGTWTKLHHE